MKKSSSCRRASSVGFGLPAAFEQVRRGIDVGDVPALAATGEGSRQVVVAVAERPARVLPAIVAVDLGGKEVVAQVVGSRQSEGVLNEEFGQRAESKGVLGVAGGVEGVALDGAHSHACPPLVLFLRRADARDRGGCAVRRLEAEEQREAAGRQVEVLVEDGQRPAGTVEERFAGGLRRGNATNRVRAVARGADEGRDVRGADVIVLLRDRIA